MSETQPAFDWDRAWARTVPQYVLRNELEHSMDEILSASRLLSLSSTKGRQPRRPRLHPTKGYRGAHKRFRGGSR